MLGKKVFKSMEKEELIRSIDYLSKENLELKEEIKKLQAEKSKLQEKLLWVTDED